MTGYLPVFFDVLRRLDEAGIEHMVVGSVASMVYGEPRLTHDLDVVVDLKPTDALHIEALFPAADFYVPPPEVIRDEVVRRGQFNLIHHDSGLKVDLVVRKATPHARAEFQRRRRTVLYDDFAVVVASAEDVILKKLEYFREGGSAKHATDIRGVLAQTEVDRAYLDEWVATLGLGAVWREVVES